MSPIGSSGPHKANQNVGDLYPYHDEIGQEGQKFSDFSIYSKFYNRNTLYEETHHGKNIARMLSEEYI
jgi:hypothetical protein